MLFFLYQTNCPLDTLVSLRNQGVVQDTVSWRTALHVMNEIVMVG